MKKRDLISIQDITTEEMKKLFQSAASLKEQKAERLYHLKGCSIGLLFQKPSNRTRVSFEVGIWQLGGNCIYLGPDEINLGKRESAHDVAKTLSRYLDAIVARTYSHQDMIALRQDASIPVINGLSELFHPCQALADIYSIKEKFGTFQGIKIAYVGDGNNVCHSLLLGCAKVGLNIHIATPRHYEPQSKVIDIAKTFAQENGTQITLSNSPRETVKDTNVIYTDVWVSMGQEVEAQERLNNLKDFQINKELISLAHKDCIFMHCLPAHRGQEVTDEVIDGPNSIVFDQAENRMHIQKAILTFLLHR